MKPSPRVREALQLLLEAYDYARELRRPVWDFAMEISFLRQSGLSNNEFRWLVYSHYLLHASDVALLQGTDQPPERAGWLSLSDQSCFVLTPEGAAFVRSCLAPPGDGPIPGTADA